MTRPTFGSVFAGIGGFDLGFERAGFHCAWQIELDTFCRAVLAKHWPDVERFGDVRECGGHNLRPVDVLIGGFPCQPVSLAGKQRAQQDERWLWPDLARLICELRPAVAVLENVPGLLVHGLGDVLGDLAEAGYDAEWTCLRAADVGAPHRRERVFVVAHARRDGLSGRGESEPRGEQGARGHVADGCGAGRAGAETVADANLAGQRRGGRDGEHRAWHERPQLVHRREAVGDTECAGWEGHRPALSERWGEPAAPGDDWRDGPWPAGPGEAQRTWEPPRVLRRVESGVGVHPDGLYPGLVRHRRRALAALGNAIVPQVAEVIARQVMAAHFTPRLEASA